MVLRSVARGALVAVGDTGIALPRDARRRPGNNGCGGPDLTGHLGDRLTEVAPIVADADLDIGAEVPEKDGELFLNLR